MPRYKHPPPPVLLERFDASTDNGTIELSIWFAPHVRQLWVETACGCEFSVLDRNNYVSDRGVRAERLVAPAQRAYRPVS